MEIKITTRFAIWFFIVYICYHFTKDKQDQGKQSTGMPIKQRKADKH